MFIIDPEEIFELEINYYFGMDLKTAAIQVLEQLFDITEQVQTGDFTRNIPSLNATIGQHTRHIVEFYHCLFEGLQDGRVNYDQRRRDKIIESDKNSALKKIREIINSIRNYDLNPGLRLEVMYGDKSSRILSFETNYERELVYNIEHTIHHMAILKQGFLEICRYVKLPENFGVASSTTRYSRQE